MSGVEIRRERPTMMLNDIVSACPMTKPTGSIFDLQFKYGGAKMGFETTVKRVALIECIKKNMVEHQSIVEEATAGYREKVIAALEAKLEEVRSEKKVELNFQLTPPSSHMKDYSRVLKMLEMDTKELITLSEEQFACYVMDEWDWKHNFMHVNARYSKKAMSFSDM